VVDRIARLLAISEEMNGINIGDELKEEIGLGKFNSEGGVLRECARISKDSYDAGIGVVSKLIESFLYYDHCETLAVFRDGIKRYRTGKGD